MTGVIRQKHYFKYHGSVFYCSDITVNDYLLLIVNEMEWIQKILLEHNEKLPTLNDRQLSELMKIVFWIEEEDEEELTEVQKKIREHKEIAQEKKKKKKGTDRPLQDFHVIEGQIMHFLNQSRTEIRSWTYKYFIEIYKDMMYCTWSKEYNKDRNNQSPDKKAFRQEFGSSFN